MIFSSAVKDHSKTVGVRNEVDETLTLPLYVQTLLGQQVLDPKWSWSNKIWQHSIITILMIYVLFGTIHVLNEGTDATLKAEGCFTIMLTCLFPLKYLLFTNNRETFRKVYVIAKTAIYDIVKENSVVESRNVLQKIKILVKILLVSALIPVIIYVITALWQYLIGERVTLSKTTSILMPMTTPFYEIGFILHAVYMFEVAFTFLVIDMWFVFLLFFFCVASDGLEWTLKVESRYRDETDEEYATRLNNGLRKFYKGHLQLMEYLNTLRSMYKWPTVIPLLIVLLSLCLIMFLMSEEIKWTFFSNMLPTLVECIAYNWFGEQIKTKAIVLNMALHNFDWINLRLSDRKSYLIIICYMNKQFNLKTAVGHDLSIFTMSTVFKAGYQAFAVLKSMEN